MRESTDWLSRLCALASSNSSCSPSSCFCGILSQTIAGYYHYELIQYFKQLYLITFPHILMFTLLALFLQTVSRQ